MSESMTPERAKALLAMMRYGEVPMAYRRACDMPSKPLDPAGLTEAEDNAVKAVWARMPGETRWVDALRRIAGGRVALCHHSNPQREYLTLQYLDGSQAYVRWNPAKPATGVAMFASADDAVAFASAHDLDLIR